MNIKYGHKLTRGFCALAMSGLATTATAQNDKSWCNGEAWYNSAFGSRHYQQYKGHMVHVNSIVPVYREINPGAGVTCYQSNGYGSYSFGWYPNSNPDKTEPNYMLREMRSHSSYAGLGYEFARPRLGGVTVAPGIFVGLFSGYPKLATPGLGGLTLIPGYSLSIRGQKFGFEAKVITDLAAKKEDRKAIIAMSWMMRF